MKRTTRRTQRGSALIVAIAVLGIIAVATTAYISSATQATRIAKVNALDVRLTHTAEAGVEELMVNLWRPFKTTQRFTDLDAALAGASVASPQATTAGVVHAREAYATGVIAYEQPDSYTRVVTMRSVGWDDINQDGILDPNEPRKIVDVTHVLSLNRSEVFDYTYFVNNYGWMTGFNATALQVNGDMRANGDFDFSGGSPTVNGSVFATANDKLSPAAAGLVNISPTQQTNATYAAVNHPRRRQAYDPAIHGAVGSSQYEQWRDFLYDRDGKMVGHRPAGAIIGDVNGHRKFNGTMLDPRPTSEIVMPDLSDLSVYTTLSQTYVDTRATFDDGTANPHYGMGAFVEVWQPGGGPNGQYVRVDTNGVVNGSAVLIGSQTNPIRIHGPVTFTQDCVIKGYVQGQGTIYTGRNVHVVGSIRYVNPPDFRGSDPQGIDNTNSGRDMLALAARRSIMMGNVNTFGNPYPLAYMTPPFTKGRWDENGNWIPPFNALETDETGRRRYESTYANGYIGSISEGINQIDAILYTSFCGGGQLGVGGGGVQFNGSIICKDEAMVIYSLPMVMNYDHRIRERTLTDKPLIDLNLPRTPVHTRSSWQDRGIHLGV